ncbi:hypothetical protein COOONC_19072, partial [Cooperia oncophora]
AEHAAPGRAFISMNYMAHSAMYTYYAITAYGVRLPKWRMEWDLPTCPLHMASFTHILKRIVK